jgi:hypothetical protein
LRLEANTTIIACERWLWELITGPPNDPLKIPTRMRYLAAGGEASLAQLIVSWAQAVKEPHLQTFITGAGDGQLVDFSRRLYGLIAALCATKITGTPASIDVTEPLRKAALARLVGLSGLSPKQAYRGPSIEIVCADHIGRGTPYLLYQPSSRGGYTLRSRENFQSLARWLLRNTIPKEYQGAVDPLASEAIGGMLFEIFKNTEDHALVGVDGNLPEISIRAMKTSHSGIAPDDLVRVVADFKPLATYCASLSVPAGSTYTHLFELSVLDSGPGFAPTWTGKTLADLSLGEEEATVRECFGRGTSKNHGSFGEGLPHVLRVLSKQRGFLRLRTGRLSMFADFSNPDQSIDGPTMLRSWTPDGGKALAPVAGSLLTIMLPMARRT